MQQNLLSIFGYEPGPKIKRKERNPTVENESKKTRLGSFTTDMHHNEVSPPKKTRLGSFVADAHQNEIEQVCSPRVVPWKIMCKIYLRFGS